LSTPPALACCCRRCTALKSMPGTVMFAPRRYRPIMNRVKMILFRRSGTLNMFLKLLSNACSCLLAVGQGVPSRRRPAVAEGRRKDLNATACGGDGLLGRFGEGVRLHPHGAVQLASPQHLHHALLGDQAAGPEDVGIDVVALEAVQGVEVDHRILDTEGVLEALQLGDAPGQRHLASLEPDRDGA